MLTKLAEIHEYIKIWIGGKAWGFEYINQYIQRHPYPGRLLKKFGATISNNCTIHPNIVIHEARGSYKNLIIGDNVSISRGCHLDISAPINFASNIGVGMEAMLFTHRNFCRAPKLVALFPIIEQPIFVEDNVIIGARAIIMPGVRIGRNSIINAGSVISRDVPEGSLVAGNPGRITRKLSVTGTEGDSVL